MTSTIFFFREQPGCGQLQLPEIVSRRVIDRVELIV